MQEKSVTRLLLLALVTTLGAIVSGLSSGVLLVLLGIICFTIVVTIMAYLIEG